MELLGNLFGTILPIAFLIVIGFFLFTNKGRSIGRNLAFGEVIEDYGIIGEEFGGKQKYILLKCKKNLETFYVLEVQRSGFGSYKVDMFKLNQETTQNLQTLLR
ncbi:MAG TPA: hypothetical protein VLF89_04675 [Candidatus Saccharimonadales bacterium]|nr:hypothetical protein [Candidatus Saccharimonadales bacterium]